MTEKMIDWKAKRADMQPNTGLAVAARSMSAASATSAITTAARRRSRSMRTARR